MRLGRLFLGSLLLLGWACSARAEPVTIWKSINVLEDETIQHAATASLQPAYDDVNQHYWFDTSNNKYLASRVKDGTTYYTKPGLFVGVDSITDSYTGTLTYLVGRSYLKFKLPDLAVEYPNYYVSKATLIGNLRYIYRDNDDETFSLYHVGDDWSEKPAASPVGSKPPLPDALDGITWSNQGTVSGIPAAIQTGFKLNWITGYAWDVTSIAQGEMDGFLSFMLRADDESLSVGNLSFREFADKDRDSDNNALDASYTNCQFTLCLELTLTPEPSPIDALGGVALTAGLLFFARWRLARRRLSTSWQQQPA